MHRLYLLGKVQVMSMVLQGLLIVLQIEIGISHLAIYSTQGSEVICTDLYCSLKKVHAISAVSSSAMALSLQCKLQAGLF